MPEKLRGVVRCTLLAVVLAATVGCGGGGNTASTGAMETLTHWSHLAVDSAGVDHSPPDDADAVLNVVYGQRGAGALRTWGEQLGPTRSSRAMAIVHVAIFEALNALEGNYASRYGIHPTAQRASVEAAVARAAHDALTSLYPAQAPRFEAQLEEDLESLRLTGTDEEISAGLALGAEVAEAVLASREDDGSQKADPVLGEEFVPPAGLGLWDQDPISAHPLALGAYWSEVRPFVLQAPDQFRAPPPPELTSLEYTRAFDEVLRLGGDGEVTATERTEEQTFVGVFWAYDGTPSLCAPPRLYNQIAMQIAQQEGLGPLEMARLLALVNVAMADTAIATWESKYFYSFWRPVTGIRQDDPSQPGPYGDDGNPDTIGDRGFTPLGAPASNLSGPNFTPPFPAYPSGHAAFGGALFETLRLLLGRDDVPFTFLSDEFNGVTRDRVGEIRPYRPRFFVSLSDAEEENAQSRIYLGIHWAFDKTEGIELGQRVAREVFTELYPEVTP